MLQAGHAARRSSDYRVVVDDEQTESLPATTSDDQRLTTDRQRQSVRADDPDVMTTDSLTLPRIEHVLRSEGVRPVSISQQIDSLRRKVARYGPSVNKESLSQMRLYSIFNKLPVTKAIWCFALLTDVITTIHKWLQILYVSYTGRIYVYTAVYKPCTRPCTAHVHGRVHDRVHVNGRVHDRYTAVYTAHTRPCTRSCTRAVAMAVYGPCSGEDGRVRGIAVYMTVTAVYMGRAH